jgi:hypothetical protein
MDHPATATQADIIKAGSFVPTRPEDIFQSPHFLAFPTE